MTTEFSFLGECATWSEH